MWHEARRQERRIRGMIVDYRKRAERRQDFYEKIQADPTQFIQIHGRRCKIHLDPAVAAAGDGAAIIVPWQGQQDNLIDRFDVRAHLDYIPPVKKNAESDAAEATQEERQCDYERYRILAQNDFLNVTEEKFLHQLYLEEQFGANAQLEAERNLGKKKTQPAKVGATIGYSYDEGDSSIGPQPFSHLMNVPTQAAAEKDSESESDDSDIDMDVAIDISKLDTTQAHELNACGRNYGMLSNDFYSYLTKDADEADALRIAREEEHEKMLLSGRKSRRERRAQKERRIACRPFSPPSYAAKEEPSGAKAKDEESDSRSPSPADTNAGKITYITSFGGEDELQPHSKITITIGKGPTQTLGESCVSVSSGAASGQATYAQKVKENLEKLKQLNETTKRKKRSSERSRRSRSRSRSRSHSHSRGRRYRGRRSYTRSYSRDVERRGRIARSRSSSYDHERRHRPRRRRSRSRSHSRGHKRRRSYRTSSSSSSSSSSSRSSSRSSRSRSNSSATSNSRRRRTAGAKYTKSRSRSRSQARRRDSSSKKRHALPARSSSRSHTPAVVEAVEKKSVVASSKPMVDSPAKPVVMISYPLPVRMAAAAILPIASKVAPAMAQPQNVHAVAEPPPPPLKRYYGRKRGTDSSSTSDTESDRPEGEPKPDAGVEENDTDERMDVDTTSERSNPLPSSSLATAATTGKQTGKYTTAQAKNPSFSSATETKGSGNGSGRLNLRERLKRKMQNLLNKQYKADKRAEIEKSERERQLQQEREDEMRELALKLRRRQRELRHKYGTPSSGKGSDSDEPSEHPVRAKSRSKEKSTGGERDYKPKRSREREEHSHRRHSRSPSTAAHRAQRYRREYSRSRSRKRSTSRRRRRSASRTRRHRASSYGRSSRHESEQLRRHNSKSRYDRDFHQNRRDRDRQRDRERGRAPRDRNWERDRDRDHERDQRDFDSSRPATAPGGDSGPAAAGSTSSSGSRSKVVISAPPKLKKLVDY